jgi:hypothetical protein
VSKFQIRDNRFPTNYYPLEVSVWLELAIK